MAAPQPVQWQNVQTVLGGQPVQQVTFAQNVVMVGAQQGGVINIAGPGEGAADRIRPHPSAPHILPRSVPGFLDREQEQGLLGRALARGQVVDLHGPDGMGKTALIGQTMQTQLPGAFPDGLVYLSARHETREELLQDLLKSFFQTSGDVKVTENDVRRYMAGKRALIAVDDVNYLEEGEAEALAQVVPQSALLVAGREQQVWGGTDVSLEGLPRQEAVALFERHWGPIAAGDRPTVEAICDALDGTPLAIVKTTTVAAKRHVPLAQVLQQVQPQPERPDPVGQAFQAISHHLSEGERQLLGGLAAPGGATVGAEALPAITGLPPDKIGSYLERLQKMGLVQANSPRYSLDDGLRPYARYAWASEEMQGRAADYYLRQASHLRGQSEDPDEENVTVALGYYYQRKQWQQVVYIARAMESYLATTGRWGQWQKRLHNAWQAARELGDRATEAWAQNQLGVIAMSAGDTAAAAGFFKGALSIWQALGDRAGMTIARWNLQILLGPPPPPPPKGKPVGKAGGGQLIMPLALATAAVLVVLVGLVVAVLVQDGRETPTVPPPPPTTAPSPQVELWLAAGCDQTYAPDGVLAIRLRSNVDGQVDLFWTDPQGSRDYLFGEQVVAGRTVSRDLEVPAGEGDWMLEADLNRGQAIGRCGFTVRIPVEPQIQIWLDEGCDRSYPVGEAFTIRLQATVEGTVDVYWSDPQSQRQPLFTEQVRADQLASRSWDVPETEGTWRLEADLNGGQARDHCDFTVEVPRVQIRLGQGCGEEAELGDAAELFFQASVDGVVSVWLDAEEPLFEREVTGDQLYREEWTVAGALGEHRLTAILQEWEVSDECPFLVVDHTPPPAPIPLKPTEEAAFLCSGEVVEVMLRWQPVTDPSGIARYDLDLEETADYPPVAAASIVQIAGTQAEFLVSGDCGYEYSWRIRAVDGAANEGAWSEPRSFRILSLSESDDTPPPTPNTVGPGGASQSSSVSQYPCTSVVLDWNPVSDDLSGVQGYRVGLERYDYSSQTWQDIEPYNIIYSTSIEVGQWVNTGNRYRWQVWAIDNVGNQGYPSAWRYFSCPIG